jgi:hypothetical protein
VIRSVIGSPVTVAFTFSINEQPTDPDGLAAGIAVKDVDGNTVSSGGATQQAVGVYVYQFVPATTVPTVYTVTCVGLFAGQAVTLVETVDVVSHRMFTLAEFRAIETRFADLSRWPTDLLETVRTEVEDEASRIMNRSWFQRFGEVWLDADRRPYVQVLKFLPVVSVISAETTGYGPNNAPAGPSVVLKASPTDPGAAIDCDGLTAFYRTDHLPFGGGPKSTHIRFVYGETSVPLDLKRAALVRARTRLVEATSGIPDRATSFQPSEGGTYTLAVAGRAGYLTGIPDVDAVYARYSFDLGVY